jgi:hypothetical protein
MSSAARSGNGAMPRTSRINAARYIAGGDHPELPRHRGADARESLEHQSAVRTDWSEGSANH